MGNKNTELESCRQVLDFSRQGRKFSLIPISVSIHKLILFAAIIYGFNVDIHENIENYIKDKKVDFRSFNVIYEFVHDLVNELSSRIPLLPTDKIIGKI